MLKVRVIVILQMKRSENVGGGSAYEGMVEDMYCAGVTQEATVPKSLLPRID